MMAGVEQGRGFTKPMVEELLTCLLGMRCALEAGFDNIVLEGDCLPLIQLLGKTKVQDSFVGFIIKDILSLVGSFSFCSWSSVTSGGNWIAHDPVQLQPYSFCSRT